MAAWFLTCLGFLLLPGPDMALITRFTLSGGTRAGARAVCGIQISFVFYCLFVVLGATVVLKASPVVVDGLRIVGGLYLLWLAYQGFRAADSGLARSSSGGQAFRAGFISNLLNPKQAVFMVIILPQFIPSGGDEADAALLLLILFIISLLFWSGWIIALGRLRGRLLDRLPLLEKIGSGFVGLMGLLLIAGVV